MAKSIKFNLICNGLPIRTIEDLQEHFAPNDILDYYCREDRLLLLWLKIRGFKKEYENVSAIKATSRPEILKELVRIFGIDMDEDDINNYFLTEEEKLHKNDIVNFSDETKVVDYYFNGYKRQLEVFKSGIENKYERRHAFEKLVSEYRWAFELDFHNIIDSLVSQTEENPDYIKNSDRKFKKKIDSLVSQAIYLISMVSANPDCKKWFLNADNEIDEKLFSWLNVYAKKKTCETNSQNVKVVEPSSKRCLVLFCSFYCMVKSADSEKWKYKGGTGRRVIFDGLEIKKDTSASEYNSISIEYITLDNE